MRFMTLVRTTRSDGPPPQALMDAIGKLGEKSFRDGTLLDTGGLCSNADAVRVAVRGGKLVVTDGPFAETKDLVGGYAIFELPSKEAAVDAAREFMDVHREHWPGWEGETEVREIARM